MNVEKILLGIISIALIVNPYFVYADEIIVSGNGDGSSNTVNISSSSTSEVTQTNEATINNNVDVAADTGNNNANQNNGGNTDITTGDANVSSQIVNSEINQSSVETGCCQGDTNIKISGNGSDSTNSVGYSQNSNTNITINNSADISNNVNGSANTGYNNANQNNGSVSISTGNIKATDVIKNNSINIYGVNASSGNGGSVFISVEGNGADSNNAVVFSNNNSVNINVANSANIVNDSHWDLNTGGNNANQNNDDVNITSGDILFQSTIENKDINTGFVDVECCELPKGGPNPPPVPPDGTPPPPPPPVNPVPNNNGCTSNCGSTNPSVGSVLGEILPVTGNYSMLLFLIGNISMLFLGGYLRLRSGRSPNYLFAR